VPNHYLSNVPHYPSVATHDEAGGVVKLRHSVDANGKTTDVQVISEHPSGYQFGEYLTKVVPMLDFLPGYRNGRPAATSYTLTWWFGRTIGW
jgi:TonB family protein